MAKHILQLLSEFASYDNIRILSPLQHVIGQLKDENILVQTIPLSQVTEDILRAYDVVCVHGCVSVNLINYLRKVPFVLWVDDLMSDLPKGNPAKVTPVMLRGYDWLLDNARSIVATTHNLKRELGRQAKTLVAPNLIDLHPVSNTSEQVLYAGGNSHHQDIQLLNDLDIVNKVIFFAQTLPHKLSTFYQNEFGEIVVKPLGSNIGWLPMELSYERYQVYMNNLSFGVGLCPLLDNRFNLCKSLWKFLEYLQQGAVSVVSNVPPYSDIPSDCCVKVYEGHWRFAIGEAFRRRKEIYQNAYEWVSETYSWDKQRDQWINCYREM